MSVLEKETIRGTVIFVVALALMIFLPAGTLNYWQAWLYLLVFSLVITYIDWYLLRYDQKLLKSRMNVGVTAEKETSQKFIQGFSSVFVILIAITSGFDHRFGWSTISTLIILLADILVFIGLWIIFLVFKENSFTSAIVEVGKGQKVITTGPYSSVRHPMYAGSLLVFFATPVALGSWWGMIFSVCLTIMLIIRLLDEEKYLEKNLSGYKEYCRKVRYHLVPFVW